jgi:two-component system, sensor histidine kinase LadS
MSLLVRFVNRSTLPPRDFRGRVAPNEYSMLSILRKLILLTALTLSALPSQAKAADVIQLGTDFSSEKPEKIDSKVDAWVGPESRDPKELLTAQPQRTGNLRFNYVDSAIWLRFAVANTSDQNRSWVLSLSPVLIDSVKMTELDPSGQVIQTSSFDVDRLSPLQAGVSRSLPRRAPAFSFSTPENSTRTIILRIQSRHLMDLHVALATPETDQATYFHEQSVFGFYYGLFFSIFLFNFLLFLATREYLYLDYIFFLASYILELSCLNGFLDFHFGQYFNFSKHLGLFASLTVVFGILFGRRFLETKRMTPRLDQIQVALVAIALVLALVDITPVYSLISVFYGYFLRICIDIAVVTLIAATYIAYRKGHRPAIFFLIAWVTFLFLPLLYVATLIGIVPNTNVPHNVTQLVTSFEMVVLSIAMADRVYVLREKKLAAEKEVEQKSEDTDALRSLIHIICHDLRNPLTVMAGHAELQLRRGKGEWKPIARAAQTQKEILDYVQIKEAIESGKQQLTLVPVSLVKVIENARFLFEERLDEKKIRWITHLEDSHVVLADPTLLTYTVISNLISNAIKFSRENGLIEIKSRTIETGIELTVRDNGIGIPRNLVESLFSNSVATTRPGTNGEQGTGFGMPLVKTVMEFFGGSISVSSSVEEEANAGSTSGTSMILRLKKAR